MKKARINISKALNFYNSAMTFQIKYQSLIFIK